MELGPTLWLIAIAGGFLLLGAVFYYGMRRNKDRTVGEKIATEAGTRQVYKEEERAGH